MLQSKNDIGLPRITVVMPSFNQSNFLEDSLCSVLGQDYPNLEFIVIDGGSTDGSREIIERYAAYLSYWRSQPDNGQTDALIEGFKRATGDILGWVNSDDVLLPGVLQHIARAYISHPETGLFGGNYVLIDENGAIIRCKRHSSRTKWFGLHGLQIISPDWFFTRKAYDKIGGLDPSIEFSMDLDLFFRMIMKGERYLHINEWFVGFRIHLASKGVAKPHMFLLENEEVRIRVDQWLREHNRIGGYNSPIILWLYMLLQVFNGNYIRMTFETLIAHGRDWHTWATSHTKSVVPD